MKTHSLSLPAWGPYNKVYTGLSHVLDEEKGIRFDVDIFPGFYRRSLIRPATVADCGAHAWKASADGRRFCYRFELEHKDRVYLDTEFEVSDRVCRAELSFVNRTQLPQSVQADLCFSLRYPTVFHREIRPREPQMPQGAVWRSACDYSAIETREENACDGLKKGEILGSGFSGIRGVFCQFISKLCYSVSGATKQIGLRYKADQETCVTVSRGNRTFDLILPASPEFAFMVFPFETLQGETLTIQPRCSVLTLDGFALADHCCLEQAFFQETEPERIPHITKGKNQMSLCYEKLGKRYDIAWDFDDAKIREFYCDDAGRMLAASIHNHVTEIFSDGTEGHFTDLFLRPVFLQPGETKTIHVTIRCGEEKPSKAEDYFSFTCNPEGEPYLFSQNLEAAVTMLNVVYPVYCKERWIKHYCPGREWDSLYTWDSGMIGVGLSAVSLKRAEECLNAYLVEPEDPDCAFIMHGSPVATQIFLFLELWQKTRDKALLQRYYQPLKRYYQFYSDKKRTAPKTGLLQTWNQFYNSGGWDDYPPQVYVHGQQLETSVTPVISTAMTVLFAKILLMFAPPEDQAFFRDDIAFFTKALEQAWDEESGYYGYVCHNEKGEKTGILRTAQGENYNKGLDGLYPYLAGASPSNREEWILEHIQKGLMTKFGVSVVDTTAGYYRKDGYWNGSVWMPHQWILSKALLDRGRHDLSYEIACKGLKVWKNETDETYNCYEHFMVENGRGAGFHQFSGLSSPVMKWFETYYVPGTVTCGFQTKLLQVEWNEDRSAVTIQLESCTERTDLVVCMKEREQGYVLHGCGSMKQINRGAYCISLNDSKAKLQISPAFVDKSL